MLKIVYISGVKLGYDCLKSLIENNYNIEHVFTYSEDKKDRSGYIDFSDLCNENNIQISKVENINDEKNIELIKKINPDVIFVIGWSSLIGEEILDLPKIGVIGHHPTLLPKHRGNAPIPWTLINGLTKSGITFMFLDKDIDKGDILIQKEFDVGFDDDANSLYNKITDVSIDTLLEVLPSLEKGSYNKIKQDSNKKSIWKKRKPEDGIIDWNSMTIYLYNWIRGLTHPYPGAFSFLENKKLFIWKAIISNEKFDLIPGQMKIKNNSLFVKTGDGCLEFLKLQFEGEEELNVDDFIKKYPNVNEKILG